MKKSQEEMRALAREARRTEIQAKTDGLHGLAQFAAGVEAAALWIAGDISEIPHGTDLRSSEAEPSAAALRLVTHGWQVGRQLCTCPVPCSTCRASYGFTSGCEECSERRHCAWEQLTP